MARSRSATLFGAGLSIAALAFAVTTTVVLTQRWHQPNYAMPISILMVAGLCTGLTAAGVLISSYRHEVIRPWLTVLTTLLFGWAYLLMFSFGLLLLIAAVISLVVRVRLSEHSAAARWRSRVGAGLALSLGLAPLSVLAIERPVVECTTDGVIASTPIWTWFTAGGTSMSGSGSGSGSSSSSNHESSGRVTIGATTYTYTCGGDRLVSFASH